MDIITSGPQKMLLIYKDYVSNTRTEDIFTG